MEINRTDQSHAGADRNALLFDVRDDARNVVDVDGTELADLRAAEIEAAQTVAELAMELVPGTSDKAITISVRDAKGVCLSLELKFTMVRL